MQLYEIYYHDAWRTKASYGRQAIVTSEKEIENYLNENLDEWYDPEQDTPITNLIEQVFQQEFLYVTIKTITVHDDGTVAFE